jgi:hypothetical protein
MRAFSQGVFFRVTVSGPEVRAFKRTWPCSGLPSRGVSFTFDTRNGDLVDIFPDNLDGAGAVALSQDAQNYGRRKLGLED